MAKDSSRNKGEVLEDDSHLPQPKRRDWQRNNRMISQAHFTYFRENMKPATYEELSKITGLSVQTIVKHMQEIDPMAIFEDQAQKLAAMSDQLFMAIYNSALKGSPQAQKLLLEVVFKFASPKHFDPDAVSADMTEDEIIDLDAGIDLLIEMRGRRSGGKATGKAKRPEAKKKAA